MVKCLFIIPFCIQSYGSFTYVINYWCSHCSWNYWIIPSFIFILFTLFHYLYFWKFYIFLCDKNVIICYYNSGITHFISQNKNRKYLMYLFLSNLFDYIIWLKIKSNKRKILKSVCKDCIIPVVYQIQVLKRPKKMKKFLFIIKQ